MRIIRLIIPLLVFVVFSCDKEKQPAIPYVYVNEILYPNSMDFINVTGYKYVNAGYRGLVVYRVSLEEFRVYERCCPYDPENVNARIIADNNSTAIDTICKSRYLLTDGTPIDGPSPYSLMTYTYYFDGDRLFISN